MSDDRNLIAAIAISVFLLIVWQFFFAPEPPVPGPDTVAEETAQTPDGVALPQVDAEGRAIGQSPGAPQVDGGLLSRDQAISDGARVSIDTPRLGGSIALKGARIDDLRLKDYRETVDPESPEIELFSPSNVDNAYFAEFGWIQATGGSVKLPDSETVWQAPSSALLTPDRPLTLVWDNGEGLRFSRTIEVDEDYLFTVTQEVENYGTQAASLFPYGVIARYGTPDIEGFFILHEGLIGVFDDKLEEVSYKDIAEDKEKKYSSTGGWLGITDKYWLAALLPDQNEAFNARFFDTVGRRGDIYQTDYIHGAAKIVEAGKWASTTNRLFAGAKVVEIIDGYKRDYGINRFDMAIDWGWLFFLTKPFFQVLHFFGELTGNFGIAILLLTVLVKLVFFPLANQSYTAMSKMKKLQPKMVELRETYADDKMKQQQELMELYKREKVNPAAGCLPIVIQIPVFFALYKVLFVTIEMRHAPFFGWIQDLSAPDPTSIFNLFGLIPIGLPDFLMIGIWPVIMGLTMFIQTKLNPAPADPVQEKVFLFMPLIFTFLLARFSAGLVIYWAWNNTLSVLQQYVIMKRMGVEVDLIGRLNPAKLFSRSSSQSSSKSAPEASSGETKERKSGSPGE